jgi:hypothetical protein
MLLGPEMAKTGMLKKLTFRILAVLFSLFLTAVFLEVALRFLPVHGGTHRQPVSDDNPILRYAPNRTFAWSAGPTFKIVNEISVNNYGFVNDVDYDENATSPLLAVVGDSYVEAFQVQFRETITGRLASEVGGGGRVYSFAISGAPLSQYLAYAEYAARKFKADALVINIVGNDFDESLLRYKKAPGYHYFAGGPAAGPVLERVDFRPSWLHEVARLSALARYLLTNLDLMNLPDSLRKRLKGQHQTPRYIGNTSADISAERMRDSKLAVQWFLHELPERTGLTTENVLFLVDGMRPSLYDAQELKTATESYFGVMREYFLAEARNRSYEAIDLQPMFMQHYKSHGQAFEFETDHHWNALGHQVAFEAVKSSHLFSGFKKILESTHQASPAERLTSSR